jgi:hypothetical protein
VIGAAEMPSHGRSCKVMQENIFGVDFCLKAVML